MATYWKANCETGDKIREILRGWRVKIRAARKIQKELGAIATCYADGFYTTSVAGFEFPAGHVPDPKKFVRLKAGGRNAWRPRARTDLDKRLDGLRSEHIGDIMKLLRVDVIGPGLTVRQPGWVLGREAVYLALPDGLRAVRGCRRVTDLTYERARRGAGVRND